MHSIINHVRMTTSPPWFRLGAHDGAHDGEGASGGEGGEGGDGGGSGAGGGGDGDDRSFSQAEVNSIMADEKRKWRDRYSDYDDLKAKADQYDEIEAENQTALEKAERERDQAKAAREAAEVRAQKVATRNAVLEQASDKEITDPKLAAKLLDVSRVEFDDDGEPTNVEELLDELVAEHEILKANAANGEEGGDGGGSQGAGGSADGGAKPDGDNGDRDFTTASREEFEAELGKYGLRART